jgi:two-component system, LytTR family, sensor histidine kinase AlgZ
MLRRLGLIVLVNTAAALLPSVLAYLYYPSGGAEYFLKQLQYSLVYAYCVGTLAFFGMGWCVPSILRIPKWLRIPSLALAFTILAVAGSLIAVFVFVLLRWLPADRFWINFRGGVRVSLAITFIFGTAITIFEGLSARLQTARLELRTRQLAEERANKLAGEARLSSLAARIHPHFLFNTLNSISALIREDPARAERTVERLAALLRYSLDTNSHPLVPLGNELRIVEDYLEIERTRFGDRLRYTIDVPPEARECDAPPLALQTLVENCIKHSIAPRRSGGEIRISARFEAGELAIKVRDDGPGFSPSALKQGHGLDNLQERLNALFGNEASMDIGHSDGFTVVTLVLPQKRVLT